ncbi:MAG: hypothetical protein CSB34_01860 [Desulfobulbus propionicus]|nr:MAG: hypothetical protein CSB34_01860 [Desulfobulbus propionicus]
MPTIKAKQGKRYSSRDKKLCRVELIPAKASPDESAADASRSNEGEKRFILCAGCRTVITSLRYGVHIDNSHEHTFFNPAGRVFELLCFSQAHNISIRSEPTTAFSWFKGYAWEIVTCSRCAVHLGWRFSRGAACFFGLIKNKLISSTLPPAQ